MYIIKDKTTNEFLFISYAEKDINLKPTDIFPGFDPEKMEFGWCGSEGIPQHFKIDADGQIIELSPAEKVEKGIINLSPFQKIENNQIVDKTLEEQVKEGLLTLAPDQEIVDNRIGFKSLEKRIKEGLITLNPDQKIAGEGDNQKIVQKTIPEQVADGTIQLQPNQKLDGESIVTKTDREMLNDGVITLDEYKQKQVQYFSQQSFTIRSAFLPDYKLQNAALGVYDEAKTAAIKATVQAFKDEFNRLQGLVEQAADADAVDAVTPNYPNKLVE